MFIDTNYFLRYFLHDIHEQNLIVENFFVAAVEKGTPLMTSTIVFFEAKWVLSKYYKKSKTEIIVILRRLLKLTFIELKEREMLVNAVNLFQKTSLDLEDCYNLFYAKTQGVSEFKTFDKKLKNEFDRS